MMTEPRTRNARTAASPIRLTRRELLGCLGAAAATASVPRWLHAAPGAGRRRKPNFVVLFTDDQGYQDVGCFGAPKIKTPNLDRMASEGMRLTDFYVPAPVCTPSRAALMTGCYPRRVGLERGVLFPPSRTGLNGDEITIAELLKRQGYATTCIGKWHLGHLPPFLPMRHGFDSYYGIPFSNDMWLPADMTYAEDAKIPADLDAAKRKAGIRAHNRVPLMRNGEVIEYPVDQRTLTERYTQEALKFIEANKDRPFFLYLPHSMPHVPLYVSDRFKGKSAGGLYGDVIECIDWSTGQILAALAKHGLDRDTLVVYTSDNGPWLSKGKHGGAALPLRAGKGTTYEGGMREPCIVRWPGKVPAGTTCRDLATTMDLLPTLAGLAGAKVPTDRVIDGKDVWPLLAGEPGAKTPHEAFFYHASGGRLVAVRSGNWKLHTKPARRRRRPKDAKATPAPKTPQVELYDLRADIGEKRNVAAEHPDVVRRLGALADAFEKEVTRNRRPVGRVAAAGKAARKAAK
jgi:arylsulfatase A